MANEQSLEDFIHLKIQALKNQKHEIDEEIKRIAATAIAKKQIVDKEIQKLQVLINEFKSGVDPTTAKPPSKRGGARVKKPK